MPISIHAVSTMCCTLHDCDVVIIPPGGYKIYIMHPTSGFGEKWGSKWPPPILLLSAWMHLHTTRSSAIAKSRACPSCLVGVLYDISQEKIGRMDGVTTQEHNALCLLTVDGDITNNENKRQSPWPYRPQVVVESLRFGHESFIVGVVDHHSLILGRNRGRRWRHR